MWSIAQKVLRPLAAIMMRLEGSMFDAAQLLPLSVRLRHRHIVGHGKRSVNSWTWHSATAEDQGGISTCAAGVVGSHQCGGTRNLCFEGETKMSVRQTATMAKAASAKEF
jgi:hypothetical protein